MSQPIRIAVPNKGRLQEPTIRLLRESGLSFEVTERSLTARVRNADIELLFVRTEDIPELVADGVARLGITGQDLLAEHGDGLSVLLELGFGRCRLAAAVPTASPIERLEDLAGARIATSHPAATRQFFSERDIDVQVIPLRGSVEVAPRLGVADAIISESGLSFLGLGIQPPTATWGNLLKNALDQIFAAPWTAIVPGLMIFLTVLSINYIGDGLREYLDPKQRQR